MFTTCTQPLIYVTILLKEIPPDGRHITRVEVKQLQIQGIRCSVRWKVLRKDGSGRCGVLYRPEKGQFIETGVEVKVKVRSYERYFIV